MITRIGLIGAMDEEIHQFRLDLETEEIQVRSGITFYLGEINGCFVVLCKSGVGKVNAAVTTQILIDVFDVSHIIFTGIAGALDEQLNVGDLVISTSAIQHDIDATALGFERGQIPMQSSSSIFMPDLNLVDLAEQAANKVLSCRVIKGRVLSGDQFIADIDFAKKLKLDFDGSCVEMEGASVAQVATMSERPFVIIRAISDNANDEATMSFTEFTELASQQSYLLVSEMLRNIKNNL
ncbi:5'-methylthioadenosine/adenosylhomocysteine nucleosidase [Alkalicoccobacillus plakortidis]|uniref:adenosylhomocysteine nucleosidase n=1 Tax=Alkalicoccobacillus plakortidis TaxID=444060 RepID=A0ABT0XHC1_9BACI|nr:5'-methylthioadenosine/adenosylhomocysteine nucleosidase [Alkalicoccobacillus plakortidis]MCM2675318.1 5'-methylthioadenosine/adenosylhomocysteine nucleosidase [Alkalicoccobacillus plakortidis]